MSHLEAPAGRETVIGLYRLLLGRDPESEAVIAEALGLPVGRLIEGFLGSEERARRDVGLLNERYRRAWPSGPVDLTADPRTLAALLDMARDTWVRLGETEAYWSVMTDPAYRTQALDTAAEARFFDTGMEEVQAFLDACRRNGLEPPFEGRVLDFGCGVGRVGLHLARRFQSYLGVDISPPHLAEARARIRPLSSEAAFLTLPDFLAAETRFDVVFSVLVMQHSAPPVMAEMLRLLIARLNPGGVGYVQIPHALHGYAYSARAHLDRPLPVGEMEMHALPQSEVFRLLAEGGARPVEAAADGRAGTAGLSTTWLFVRD